MAYLDLNGLKRFKQKLVAFLGFITTGKGRFSGDIYVNSTSATTGEKVATVNYVDNCMAYTPISINSLSVSPTTYEVGASATNVKLQYTLSKVPTLAKLDNVTKTISSTSGTITEAGPFTVNKEWTLYVEDTRPDGVKGTATKKVSIAFTYYLFAGASVSPGTINSSFVRGLATKALKTTQANYSFTANADTAAKYLWFACPKSYGKCAFNVNGFDGGFRLVGDNVSVNLPTGTTWYYVYRSDNPALGNTTVKVSKLT